MLRCLDSGGLNGTAQYNIQGQIIGGVLISVDGTNQAIVQITNRFGKNILYFPTYSPAFIKGKFLCEDIIINVSCTGTGAGVSVYEYIS